MVLFLGRVLYWPVINLRKLPDETHQHHETGKPYPPDFLLFLTVTAFCPVPDTTNKGNP